MIDFRSMRFLCVAMVLMTAVSFAGELPDYNRNNYFSDGETLGINVLPVDKNLWYGQHMETTRKIQSDELYRLGEDFFKLEYGSSLAFEKDRLKEFDAQVSGAYTLDGNVLNFNTGKTGWSMLFGAEAKDYTGRAAIRLGRGWGKFGMIKVKMIIDLEQDVENSSWFYNLCTTWGAAKPFKVSGKGRQKHEVFLGLCQNFSSVTGIMLKCATPNINMKIHSVKIVPFAGAAYWYRKFNIDFDPVRAGFSYTSLINKWTHYDIHVNGKLVTADGRFRKCDITKFLKKGENTIIYRDEFYAGYGSWTDVLLDLFAIGRNGEKLHIGGDSEWRWSYNVPENWKSPDFRPENWQKPRFRGASGIDKLRNGHKVALGMIPLHAGLMEVKQVHAKFPVFDYDSDIAYEVRIPDGVKNAKVNLVIRDSEDDRVVETLEVAESWQDGVWRAYTVAPKTRDTGAYRLQWTLMSGEGGKVLDTYRSEMIVAGPLKQDEFALKDFESELDKRLRLVQKIDCSAKYGEKEFLDHAGLYQAPKLNKGCVKTKNGMTYRETGEDRLDLFCYKLNITKPGDAMIAEVVYPDNEERYINVAIAESMPAQFENNRWPLGSNGWTTATGSVFTGGLMPLTYKKKKLRVVFFPSSKNTTIMVQTGLNGKPAAACEINLYTVNGGLPALSIPKSGRTYANHNERIIFAPWGGKQDPRFNAYLLTMNGEMREGFWSSAYFAVCNKLRYMRYAGHNASVDGVYMYKTGFPSQRGHGAQVRADDFDFFYPLLKMYKHNNIKQFLCFEYIFSPNLWTSDALGVSDRELRKGTARPLYHVTRYGKQCGGFQGHGLNHNSPAVWDSVKDVMKEIYERYSGVGNVEGVFLVCGRIWLPGYSFGDSGQFAPNDVGYDDDSTESFEADTGIKLGIPNTGKERFDKRYKLLTGKYAREWAAWRCEKLHEKVADLKRVVSAGSRKWKMFVAPQVIVPKVNPFNSHDGTPAQRDAMFVNLLKDSGFDPQLYSRDEDVTLVPHVKVPRSAVGDMPAYGNYTNRNVRRLYRDTNSVYMSADDLNEIIGVKVPAAKFWWWRRNNVSVYDRKFSGEFAFNDMVDVASGDMPKHVFQAWLDVNVPTAHGKESRRFLKAFYSTPLLDFVPFANIAGVQAKLAGNYLQLINDTPYAVKGRLKIPGGGFELVYDKKLGRSAELEIRPYGVLVVKAGGEAAKISGEFEFDDETEKLIRSQTAMLSQDKILESKIPQEALARINQGLQNNDFYGVLTAMREFDVFRNVKSFLESESCFRNQNRLLEMLKNEEAARINCGSQKDVVDGKGRLWLPDQEYSGFGAYGNECGAFVSRGNIAVANTDTPEIYRSEVYAHTLYYHIPLPADNYKVKLHFAETFIKNKECGRKIMIRVPGFEVRTINPVLLGGGYQSAAVVIFDNVKVEKMLSLEFGGNPQLNAIEIIPSGENPTAFSSESKVDEKEMVFNLLPERNFVPGVKEAKIDDFFIYTGAAFNGKAKRPYFTVSPDNGKNSLLFVNKEKMSNPEFAHSDFTISACVRLHGRNGQLHFLVGNYRIDLPVENGRFLPAFVLRFSGDEPAGSRKTYRYLGCGKLPRGTSFSTEEWHHVAVSISRQSKAKFFVDGTPVFSAGMEKWLDVNMFDGAKPIISMYIPPKICGKDYAVDVSALSVRSHAVSSPLIRAEANRLLSR